MHKVYDTIIIGGGIAGASLGYFLAPHQSVLILERENQCGYHSTGRSAAEYTERFHSLMTGILTKASYDFLMNPPKGFSEVDLLIRRGNLVIADEEKATHLLETYEAECEKSPGLVLLTKEQAIERAPILNNDYIAAAFYDPDCWEIEVETLVEKSKLISPNALNLSLILTSLPIPKINLGMVTSTELEGISLPVALKTSIVSSDNEKLQALKVDVTSLAINPNFHFFKSY